MTLANVPQKFGEATEGILAEKILTERSGGAYC